MARLFSLLREAKALLDQGRFATCTDKLDELQRRDEKGLGDVDALPPTGVEIRIHSPLS